MKDNEQVEMTLHEHHRTSRAILVSDDGEGVNAVWLPFSQIEVEEELADNIVVIRVPEWLAMDKGLI